MQMKRQNQGRLTEDRPGFIARNGLNMPLSNHGSFCRAGFFQ